MHFFPSRNITMYMARLFVVRSFAVLMMLVLVLMTLDLLGESGKILAVPGNDQGDVLRYVTMRAPQIIARFLPFSVLLGTLITFATLSQNSEVVAMKAAGLSAHQILAPMFVASLGVAPAVVTGHSLGAAGALDLEAQFDVGADAAPGQQQVFLQHEGHLGVGSLYWHAHDLDHAPRLSRAVDPIAQCRRRGQEDRRIGGAVGQVLGSHHGAVCWRGPGSGRLGQSQTRRL